MVRYSHTNVASLSGHQARDDFHVCLDYHGKWAWPVLGCQQLEKGDHLLIGLVYLLKGML